MSADLAGASSTLSPQEWHDRFIHQAGWTAQIRAYLYQRAGLASARRVLDIGCGTGVLLPELAGPTTTVFGIDLDRSRLSLAHGHAPDANLAQADAFHLPFPPASIDICLCHFLLLWLVRPERAVVEMARLIRPGGAVLLLAEPDYGGRIDYPATLQPLGRLQAESLRRQGADPETGRRLGEFLATAGLVEIETGVLGGLWSGPPDLSDLLSEWKVLEADLKGLLPAKELSRLKTLDGQARQSSARTLFVPTFFGKGRRPE